MALMEWNADLSVGIVSIDTQHKKLINMINTLNEAMSKGKGKEMLESLFDDIVQYTVTHFEHEIKLFDMHSYPDAVAHKKEHEVLVNQARELQDKFKSGSITVTLATQKFLLDWLKDHIQGTDKKYSQFFISKGVK
jgi:hemerythrin-like metal-binding protein